MPEPRHGWALIFPTISAFRPLTLPSRCHRQARERLEQDGWAHLTAGTEARRDEVARQFESMRRDMQMIAANPAIRARAARLAAGAASGEERGDLQEELTSIARTLGYRSLTVFADDGRTLFRAGSDTTDAGRDQLLMHEALHAKEQ